MYINAFNNRKKKQGYVFEGEQGGVHGRVSREETCNQVIISKREWGRRGNSVNFEDNRSACLRENVTRSQLNSEVRVAC